MRDRNPRHDPPTLWLMTDERIGDALWPALRRLPPGSGVVFRHRATPAAQRHALFLRVRRIAQARRLVIVSVGPLPATDGIHGRGRTRGIRTWPAHDRRQALIGKRAGARLLFVSPLYPTRSHPGTAAIGPGAAALIGRALRIPMIALGGMDADRWRRVRRLGFAGWAAIDSLTR